MKKTISALLSATMLAAVIPAAVQADVSDVTVYTQALGTSYINADFNDNQLPSGMTKNGNISFADGTVVCGIAGTKQQSDLRTALSSERCRIEYDIYTSSNAARYKFQTSTSGSGFNSLANHEESDANSTALRFRDASNAIVGTAFLNAKTWYHIQFDLDTDNHTYTAHVNDASGNVVSIFKDNKAYPFLSSTLAANISKNSTFIAGTTSASEYTISMDNFGKTELTMTDVNDGAAIFLGNLGSGGKVYAKTSADTLYDKGNILGTSVYKCFDITDLAYGEHTLSISTGGDGFRLNYEREISISKALYKQSLYYDCSDTSIPSELNKFGEVGISDGEMQFVGGTSESRISKSINADTTRFEFDMYVPDKDGWTNQTYDEKNIFRIQLYTPSASSKWCTLGNYFRYGGGALSLYSNNSYNSRQWLDKAKWYHLVFDIDTKNKTYTLTTYNADGTLRAQTKDLALQSEVASDSQMRIGTVSNSDQTVYIDNIRQLDPTTTVKAGDTITASALITNNTDTAKNAVLTVTLFDGDGRFINLGTDIVGINAKKSVGASTSLEVPDTFSAGSIRSFVVSDFKDLTPLADVSVIE